ncbi:uncharacterized protein LOC129940619 [Eupeodes corollae]|uniref:uncharacterized protein LOC129940619 n=1 Tax=Eupeodes corollae TaxID=290404 RepID=UPI002493AD90|nr:uncharacterized protein LOC129940619 [Eupeodes corollae]
MDYIVYFLVVAVKFELVQSKKLSSDSKLIEFLKEVQKREAFDSLLILRQSNFFGTTEENFFRKLHNSLEVPLIQLTEKKTFLLKESFNRNILTVIFLESWNEELLGRLLDDLHQIRTSRIIYILSNEKLVKNVFKFCWNTGMINALAILGDFKNSSIFYSFTIFPAFVVEQNIWIQGDQDSKIFPNRLRNLNGYTLPIFIGGPKHTMIVTRNKYGHTVLKGFLGHLFEALLTKHNATLNSSNFDLSLPSQVILKLVLNNTIEISAAATYPEIPMDSFTYPYDLVDWCIMLPVEARMSISKVFMIIFEGNTFIIIIGMMVIFSALLEWATTITSTRYNSLLNYFFNDSIFRGILGQSFTEEKTKASITIKLIYLLVFLLGLNVITLYGAFLQTYSTHPPSEPRIQSFDDLLASKLKVYSLKQEVNRLVQSDEQFRTKYYGIFLFEKNFSNYAKLEFSFDTKYAYVLTNIKWIIIDHRQKTYSQPIFRLPKGMCLFRNIPMAFPIYENSIFKDIMNFLLLEIQSAGLMDFWKRRTFYELVEAGKLKLNDLTTKRNFKPMQVKDLTSIWVGIGLGYITGGLCFLSEICAFKWKIRREIQARWEWYFD